MLANGHKPTHSHGQYRRVKVNNIHGHGTPQIGAYGHTSSHKCFAEYIQQQVLYQTTYRNNDSRSRVD